MGLAYLSRDSQGSSGLSPTGGVQVEEAYGELSKVLGPRGLDLSNVIPSRTFCFQITWIYFVQCECIT